MNEISIENNKKTIVKNELKDKVVSFLNNNEELTFEDSYSGILEILGIDTDPNTGKLIRI